MKKAVFRCLKCNAEFKTKGAVKCPQCRGNLAIRVA